MAADELAAAAFTTKGLEDVTAGELRDLMGEAGQVAEPGVKHVLFTPDGSLDRLRSLATADDVCLLLTGPLCVRTAGDLAEALAERADWAAVLPVVASRRPADGTFSVTVTAARSPLGGTAKVAEVATAAIARRLGWQARERERAPVDIRVFLDGTSALLGVRLFDLPLVHRDYRQAGLMGSLRPTVAAAMVRLTRPGAAHCRVWDPFCGSGTILAESALAGHHIAGTDSDSAAVAAAQANLAAAGLRPPPRIELGDSATLATWRRHQDADTVLTNMPWGKQVPVSNAAGLYQAIGAGIAQLAGRGGQAAVLTTSPDRLAAAARRADRDMRVTRRQISLLGQAPTLLTFSPHR